MAVKRRCDVILCQQFPLALQKRLRMFIDEQRGTTLLRDKSCTKQTKSIFFTLKPNIQIYNEKGVQWKLK